ncbi:MAG: tRNA (adenosine(37)-N6)-threonylcarbamoyltransferase complex dimerization subunit type 1 TsaB [Prevotellaceae bacterium]|jgi:tRNA threonylcarbamoyladenosine biosynthesis protein TsaB|nr:tRNA (adenosine(37)-N6)-threonylcarbamoyltransferase complex dimerization subunit type 1 TsaB [Prevotellaceae bacterium]
MNEQIQTPPLILYIETGTDVCSVALSRGGAAVAVKERREGRLHAKLLAVLIDELLREQHVAVADLAAVAVSEGPGSYTGLRVGVSTAKGLCYGARKPLIAVGSLQSLAFLTLAQLPPAAPPDALIVPMIDARRMEVFTAVFDTAGRAVEAVEARIVEAHSFDRLLDAHHLFFAGDGADKCREALAHPHAHFLPVRASAVGMITPAFELFCRRRFADAAYFEPFYLKNFVALPSKKRMF